MKATKQEIEDYIRNLFLISDFDFNGYIALKKFEQKCINAGEIIFLR